MKKFSLLLTLFLIINSLFAQITSEGTPYSMRVAQFNQEVPVFITPTVDIQQLKKEDKQLDLIKEIPWRYGYIHYVDVDMEKGQYDYLPNGDRIWRLRIKVPAAQTINLTFDQYYLQEGAQLFLYTLDYKHQIGALTAKNNKEHGFLTTTLIPGEEIMIELYEPKATIGLNRIHIQRIVHGYRALTKDLKYIDDSGFCNINVVCPLGDDWRDQIRSVGILLTQNNLSAGFCSGALINNTCQNGAPYFLTANHCGADDPTTVVGFNFQSTVCASSQGPYLENTISGVIRRASNSGSDFMLLELSQAPPPSYNVYYSGWDRSGTTTNGQVGIHHPSGDLKKICRDDQVATQATYSNAQCWEVGNWEEGTTEGGSSGSPLFNLNGHIIGQLYGGSASCQSITEDYYGRFDVSWDNGSGPSDELQSWLDPSQTNAIVLDGFDPNEVAFNEDAALFTQTCGDISICGNKIQTPIVIKNKGNQVLTSATIEYGYFGNYQSIQWTGNLNTNEQEVILPDSLDLATGLYNMEAYFTSTNLTNDEFPLNDTARFRINAEGGIQVEINLRTNFAANENQIIITDENGGIVELEDNFSNLSSYSFSYCLPLGEYCISITDDGGNGLSPTIFFDDGNYQLIIDGIEVFNSDDIEDEFEYCVEKTTIQRINEQNHIQLYPNPNKGNFTIIAEEELEEIAIYSVLGKEVLRKKVNGHQYFLETDLSTGIYIVQLKTVNGIYTEKIRCNE